MMNIQTCRLSLPLKKKFVVSKGGADIKTNVVTVLDNRYYGEAAGSVHYGPTVEIIEANLRQGIEYLNRKSQEELTVRTLGEIKEYDIAPVAKSALMGMILNYVSGKAERYPWELLGLGTPVGIKTSFTVGIDEPQAMLAAIKESSYPIIKIKLGFSEDKQVVDGLKDIIGKDIRIDANGGWDLDKAEEMIFYLAKNGVKIVEQPTDVDQITEWKHLKGRARDVELFLDEGINSLEDYEQVADYVDGINIKMEKSGGILGGIDIARKARKDKRKVMLGCMVESSIGIAQSVYMSSLADYYDLDGPLLLDEDIATGISYEKERIGVDREILGGPKLRRDAVEKYAQCD